MLGNHKHALGMMVLVMGLFFLSVFPTDAALKDSDVDGIIDEAEVNTYHTNPNQYDTDGDGFDDGYEIVNESDPLDANNTPFMMNTKGIDATVDMPIAWYIARASGILAFILFSIVVINGLLMTTRLVFKLLPPALNYEMHTFISYMGLMATIGHVVALMFDQYFTLTWIEAIVPFSIHRDFLSPTGFDLQWTIGIGSLALYGILALIITSEMKGSSLKLKTWRAIHFIGFPVYFLFLIHGIFSGSDTQSWWMMWIYAMSGGIVTGLIILRVSISVKRFFQTSDPVPSPQVPPRT